jgi:hypothetical protein
VASTLEGLDTPIVALACQDRKGEFHFMYCEKPIFVRDLDFQDDILLIGNFALVFDWFNAVTICTEETLRELKHKLQNA